MTAKRFESRTVGLLKSTLFAVATLIMLWSQTSFVPMATAVIFAVVGSQLGRSMSKRRLHLRYAIGSSLSAGLLSWLSAYLVRTYCADWLSQDAATSLVIADTLGFSLLALSVAFFVRYMSTRNRFWAVAETALVIASVVLLFARHQGLAYHRPRFLSDWALVNGLDPQVMLQGIGVATALLAIAMLLWKQSRQKLLLSIILLGFLGAVAYEQRELLQPEPPIEDFLQKESGQGTQGEAPNPDDKPYPVAVALLHSDYAPDEDLLYFRQQVQAGFNGKRLISSPDGRFTEDVITTFPSQSAVLAEGSTPTEGFHKRVPTSMFLMVDHPQPLGLTSSVEIRPRPNPSPAKFVAAYDVVSWAPNFRVSDMRLIGRGSIPADWSSEKTAYYLATPDDPRYESLANEIIREVDPRYVSDTFVKALAIKRYLEEKGFYTRKERHDRAEDPAASFLFGNLKGYCVHFAHAAALLFRSVGIASRVAVGYAVDNRMRGNGSAILIMGDRAHAWPEIHLNGIGWMPLDIYPEQGVQPPPQLVSQDLESLLGELARDDKSGGRAEVARAEPFRFPWSKIGLGLKWLLIIGLLFGYVIKSVRRLRPRISGTFRQEWAFIAVLDQLSDLGFTRRFGETRERHAIRLQALVPSFGRLTQQHLALSLGSKRKTMDMAVTCTRVTDELKRNMPTWKRLLGTLNPLGWYFTR